MLLVVVDPELFIREGECSSHASGIPYFINQMFPSKGRGRAQGLLDPPMIGQIMFAINEQIPEIMLCLG